VNAFSRRPQPATLAGGGLEVDAPLAAATPWPALGGVGGWLRAAVLLLVTAAVLASLVSWAGTTDVVGLLRGVSGQDLVVATLLTLILPLSHACRLQVALAATDQRLGFNRALQLTLAVWPISSLTPAKAGDLIKAYHLREEIPATLTAGALLTERAVGLAVWGALSLVASLLFGQAVITAFSAAVLGGILLFLFVLAPRAERLPLSARWRDRLGLLLRSTRGLTRRRLLLALVGLTLVNCAVTVLVTAALFEAVGVAVPLGFVTAAILPAMFAGLLPFTLAGMGTRDSVLIVLFAGYASAAQSLSVGLLYAFFFRWLLSLLGLAFLHQIGKAARPAAG
jgi:uncharacterized membrane protein YbhN (UPF0104 family)